MKKLVALLIAMAMTLSLAACGGSSDQPAAPAAPAAPTASAAPTLDKQDAIDAFNKASTIYDALVNKMNAEIELYPADLIEVMNEMADAMIENKEILESDQELTEENVKEMIAAFAEVEKWAVDTEAVLDDLKAQTGDKNAVIEVFNTTSTAFDTMTAKINANITAYPQEVIDVMTQMADSLIECKTLLESDTELTAEEADTLIRQLTDIKNWVDEADAVIVEGASTAPAAAGDKQAAIEAFNAASSMFDAIAAEVNAHPQDFNQEFIDGMIQIAEGLTTYKGLLESGENLTQEQINEIIEISTEVTMWALEIESEVFG
ncbi:MAG: hypothetical protein II995_03405 [Oscillospiraceae bacterium]|nr:hypothetical protein [Oscillospiraceae bacterium]